MPIAFQDNGILIGKTLPSGMSLDSSRPTQDNPVQDNPVQAPIPLCSIATYDGRKLRVSRLELRWPERGCGAMNAVFNRPEFLPYGKAIGGSGCQLRFVVGES